MPEERILDEHPRNRAERFLPHVALVRARDPKTAQLQLRRRLTGAEFDPSAADQVERCDPFRDARGMIVSRWQQHDPVPQPNLLGALTRRGQKNLRRRRMCVLLQKVMLDFPHVIDSDLVGEFHLVERILEKF